ncbi:hypothetical protein AMTRI_Chr02g266470 [Amborella trichopoda]
MEARIKGRTQQFYSSGVPEFMLKGKGPVVVEQSRDWDPNDWKWDANLFIATPLSSTAQDCQIKQFFLPGSNNGAGNSGAEEAGKRRRVEAESNNEEGALTLKLGEHAYPILDMEASNCEGKGGKKCKVQGGNGNRSTCQVDDCQADLNNAKDYHRRHKVCEMHAKATNAPVGQVMQRFCQQCSRFHVLQEFDEGKRSCRRRLAGHNRRRRKTHPDVVAGGDNLNDERASGLLLISLLKILSYMHSNSSERTKGQDLLSQLLRNIAGSAGAGALDGMQLAGLLQTSQTLQNVVGTSSGTSSEKEPVMFPNAISCATGQESSKPSQPTDLASKGLNYQDSMVRANDQAVTVAAPGMPQKVTVTQSCASEAFRAVHFESCKNLWTVKEGILREAQAGSSMLPIIVQESSLEKQCVKPNNFDLNSIYNESQDCVVDTMVETNSPDWPSCLVHDPHQISPTQTSGASDSASDRSPSSSSGDVQSRTDRIVFKLFDKDPSDLPLVLRGQILDWLSHSPTDIESYIRPGCIVLTIYLHLVESMWEELSSNLSSSLGRLLELSNDNFWRTGWIYATVQHRIAFIYNGRVMLELPYHSKSNILSVTPFAVAVSAEANFTLKGFNLSHSKTRLLCAYEGNYLNSSSDSTAEENFCEESSESDEEENTIQSLSITCSFPDIIGGGFIEVEDHDLHSGFFPFVVAEQDVCSEIRTLESTIELSEFDDPKMRANQVQTKNQVMEFLNEMGWLLRRNQLMSLSNGSDIYDFPLARFKWLLEFSMERDWCAVVKKLLDVVFEGKFELGERSSVELMLCEVGPLHRAVRRNCRSMVDFLLRYVPTKISEETVAMRRELEGKPFLFRPDMIGLAGVTPLHIAASMEGAEGVLDALTDDPGQVGIQAWKNAKDKTGFSPEDYARLRGYTGYIDQVQRKVISQKQAVGHVVLDMSGLLSTPNRAQTKQIDYIRIKLDTKSCQNSDKLTSFNIDKGTTAGHLHYCKLCDKQLAYKNAKRSLLYRPAMLSMVAIAAVCVCVGLLLKGPPEVIFVFPFRWELLGYGPI